MRKSARQYNYSKVETIERFSTENPQEFWDAVKRLGPKKSTDIPLKVRIDGNIEADFSKVKDKWQADLS